MAIAWMPVVISAGGMGAVVAASRALVVPEGFEVELPLTGLLRRKREHQLRQGPLYVALFRVLRFYVYHLGPLLRLGVIGRLRARLEGRLSKCGYPAGLTVEEFLALHLVAGTVAGAVGLWCSWTLSGLPQPFIVLTFAVCGAFLPSFWLTDRERFRIKVINRSVPYVLDLLTLSLSAGLDFVHGLQQVIESRPEREPMREELELLLHEISMGKTRREALLDFKARVNAPNVADVVSGIVQAERMGTPMGHTLRVHASSMRVKRTHRAEKLAGQAAVKMIGPMVLLVGAVLLTVFGSIIVQVARSGLGF